MTDYAPYGTVLQRYAFAKRATRFMTTYHERDSTTKLDYRGARFSDPEIGGFLSVDPLAGERPGHSPYNYCSGNPIMRTDPTGMIDDWYQNNETNEVEWHEGSGAKEGYTYLGKEGYAGHGDNTGLAFYGNADGTKSYYGATELDEVTSVLHSPSRDAEQARRDAYGPWMGPDAISVQVNGSASGLFMESGFSAGIAMSGSEIGVLAVLVQVPDFLFQV